LRLVARYADACNLFATGTDEVAHKLEVLERHCAVADRDPASIERTILFGRDPLADVDEFVTAMTEYARLGVGTVDLMPTGDPVAYVERVGSEIVPRLAELGPAR
jgi:alkanesulfonate monooxygenase SsuD/methylene tetrahydromethanopterin reductase-like flavin-dependent oxidoreductase (luciferase family)